MKKRVHPAAGQVRLLPGTPQFENQRYMDSFLLEQDTGSMLYNFRAAAGLDVRGAEPMTGWDAGECKLRGHTTGHYMSGLSLAYADGGDERFRTKLAEVVDGLRECQLAFASHGRTGDGFLSAYDEEQFDLLEKFTEYPEIWAPYYTLDKIMAGLLDAYELAGITEALDILIPLGDWVGARLSRLSPDHRAKMWSMYIAGEYGAMMGTLIRLHRITGRNSYLETAMLFENPALFHQMEEGRDELAGMHANQHIPQIIGTLEMYTETGDPRCLKIAETFAKTVIEHHCYVNGGTGEEERFREADRECEYLTASTAESCASYNMMRLAAALGEYADEEELAELMAYYENTLFNHIMVSWSHRSDGGTTYFLPLAPGSVKHYETEENSCCHGTGMETRYRYTQHIYSVEENTLRVDLPVSSTLRGDEEVTVRFSDDGTYRVTADRDMKRRLAVRVPAWARKAYPEAENGYLYSAGPLRAGQSLELKLPVEIRMIPASDPRYITAAKGPYMLAVLSDSKEFMAPPGDESAYVPLYTVDEEAYHIYYAV